MKNELMNKEIMGRTPALYATEDVGPEEKIVTAKYFAGGLTWYMVEYDQKEKIAFGYVRNEVDPICSEWGYFSISEFEEYNRTVTFPIIERDGNFDPVKFKDLNLE